MDVKPLSPEELRLESNDVIFQFDQDFSALTSVVMKHYDGDKGESGLHKELIASPLKIQGTADVRNLAGYRGYSATRAGDSLMFKRRQGPWQITQTFVAPQNTYSLKIHVEYENISNQPEDLTSGLLLQQNIIVKQSGGFGPSFAAHHTSLVHGVDGGRDFEDLASICKKDDVTSIDSFKVSNDKIDFLGIDLHYFLTVFKPETGKMSAMAEKTGKILGDACPLSIVAFEPMGYVKPGEKVALDFTGYLGPKDLSVIEAHDPAFARTLNFKTLGMNLSVLAKPLLHFIQFVHSFIPNYGVAIILLTLCLKIVFYPLTKSAALSMKRMQKLQPEIAKLREKFKDDPQKQQQQLMAFMAKNKANPMKGCLPILPQMPVFFAFYSVLSQAIELRHAAFFGWISDLSVADPYYILPLVLGGLMFLQQKMTPNPGMDPNQQKIMMIMPVVFTFMMLALPAGLTLYMVANTVISIGQQQWLNRKFANMDFKVVPA